MSAPCNAYQVMANGLRRWGVRIAGATAALGVLGLMVIVWLGSSQAIYPPWYEHRTPEQGLIDHTGDEFAATVWQGAVRDPLADLDLAYQDVEFLAVDGSTLRGWLIPGPHRGRAAVVAVHGAGADRREFLRQAPLFYNAGYATLLFDCREQGVSDGAARGISLGFREHHDVSSAVAYVHQQGFDRVAVIGTSQGGASVIMAAAADRTIDAVIAENPFTSVHDLVRDVRSVPERFPRALLSLVSGMAVLRMGGLGEPSPLDVVDRIAPRPLLLMHGTEDTAIPHSHSQALYERAADPKELWIVPDGRHAMLYNSHPDEWRQRVLGFLSRSIGGSF